MRSIATTWNNNKGPDREIIVKVMARRNFLKRLNQLAKAAAWDDRIPAAEKWLGKICRGLIGFSAVYFIAVLILR